MMVQEICLRLHTFEDYEEEDCISTEFQYTRVGNETWKYFEPGLFETFHNKNVTVV